MSRTLDEWLVHAEAVHPRSIVMGLERVRLVGQALALLPWPVPSIIVAGTNGKGSVTVGCEQILLAHGRRVGSGYSPHLQTFNERIRINGQPVDNTLVCAGFARVDAARGDVLLTYFEYAMLVSLWCWRELQVDCTVLEVGLGGRLDAFNAVDAQVAVVTSIGLDHQEYLGSTRELIGREKAGVFRRGQAVVLGRDMPDSVWTTARELACRVAASGVQFKVAEAADWLQVEPAGGPWDERLAAVAGQPIATRLAPQNLALSVMAASVLEPLRTEATRAAVGRAALPGRMERIVHQDRTFVLDIAHNPAGSRFLADRLQQLGWSPALAILGTLADKDPEGIAIALTERIPAWIAVSTPGPRGQDAALTASGIRAAGGGRIDLAGSMAAAIQQAVNRVSPDGVILIFGSFAVVAQARDILGATLENNP